MYTLNCLDANERRFKNLRPTLHSSNGILQPQNNEQN